MAKRQLEIWGTKYGDHIPSRQRIFGYGVVLDENDDREF